MSSLDERLRKLEQSGRLSAAGVVKANTLREFFRIEYGVELTEENASAFFIHFCMALHRQETGEVIEPMGEDTFGQLKGSPHLAWAMEAEERIRQQVAALPPQEHHYTVTHLVLLRGRLG